MTVEGEAGLKESIQMSQYWEEQLKAMPYLSSKYLLIFQYNVHIIYREKRQDAASAEGEIQASAMWPEEEEDCNSRHFCRIQGLEEEAIS